MRTPPNQLPCWTERTNMPTTATFHSWLGTLFGHSESQVLLLLDNKTALQFLVAWSLFESKCFAGYVRAPDIAQYAQRTAPSIGPTALMDGNEIFGFSFRQNSDCVTPADQGDGGHGQMHLRTNHGSQTIRGPADPDVDQFGQGIELQIRKQCRRPGCHFFAA